MMSEPDGAAGICGPDQVSNWRVRGDLALPFFLSEGKTKKMTDLLSDVAECVRASCILSNAVMSSDSHATHN